jgi:hypothetical protein
MSKTPSTPPPIPIRLNSLPNRARDQFGRVSRWLKDCFERDNLVAGLKTLLWLVPMTLLIWVYAEREQVLPLKDQTIPIDVRSDEGLYVRLTLSGSEKSIIADLAGPRSRLDEVRTAIEPQDGKASVVVTIPDGLSPGRIHEPDIADLLNKLPLFERRGVTVSNCKPSNIQVFVDKFEEREFEVVKSESVANLASEPIFEPKLVRVRAPASAFKEAEASGPLRLVADLAGSGQLNIEGMHEATVRVSMPNLTSDAVTYSPASVKATFEVRSSSVRGKLASVPVFVLAPPTLWSRYEVQIQGGDVIFNVGVVGPADKIADLERPDSPIKPWAVLQVDSNDYPNPKGPRRLKFDGLPDGVRVSDEDQQRTVEFKLVPKALE